MMNAKQANEKANAVMMKANLDFIGREIHSASYLGKFFVELTIPLSIKEQVINALHPLGYKLGLKPVKQGEVKVDIVIRWEN